jgi:osmotically-inducible protein OsmY
MRSRVTVRNRPEPLEDEELQQLITERIEEDPVFWSGSGRRRTYVNVEVEDGHVVLSGVVRSPLGGWLPVVNCRPRVGLWPSTT